MKEYVFSNPKGERITVEAESEIDAWDKLDDIAGQDNDYRLDE